MMKKSKMQKLLPLAVGLAFSGSAWAAGFALQNQNGSGNGNAFAGAAAAADDAGTIFFNPAGMALLPAGANLSLAATYLDRKIEFTNAGTAPLNVGLGPFPLGTNGGDGGGGSVIPAGYFSYTINDQLTVGLGVSPTFGNKTEYTGDFIGRFSGYFADLKVINLNPSLAYRVSDRFVVGGGLNHGSAEVEFRQRVPVVVAGPAQFEGDVNLAGDDDAWGWNVGAIYQPTSSMRLGFAYRSTITYDLQGQILVTSAASGAVVQPATAVTARLETPDSASIAVAQQLDDKWEMLGDLTWTGWSSVQTLAARNAAGTTVASLAFNFKDTMRVGLGANYRYSPEWKFRFGVAWDESPVRADADRTMTLPDSDRTWLSVGARYALSKDASIDVGYTHIFFDDAATARAVAPAGTTLQTVRGTFDTSADLLSLQYNAHF